MSSAAQPVVSPEARFQAAIDRLWNRFLPEIRARVAILNQATVAVATSGLTAEQRMSAQSAAHKLSGVLGTFGLTRGTALARELEMIFSCEYAPSADASEHLTALVEELNALVENRPSAS